MGQFLPAVAAQVMGAESGGWGFLGVVMVLSGDRWRASRFFFLLLGGAARQGETTG